MIQILYLLFMALMLTIFFIYKNLFLHKNKIMKVLSVILIFTIVFIFYYIFRNLIRDLIILFLVGIYLIFCEIYNFFTGEHLGLFTSAIMPIMQTIMKSFYLL